MTANPFEPLDATRLRALSVPLSVEARERLRELARRERRAPRQQAALLLERMLLERPEAPDR